MNLKQTAYFMTLVGGLAGLLTWAVVVWLADLLRFEEDQAWIIVTINTMLMGALIGGLTVGFADKWAGEVVARWVLLGILFGVAAGFLSGLLCIPVLDNLIEGNPGSLTDFLGRSLSWLIAGGLIGLVIGLRWFGVNKNRAVHALLGGMIGGFLGGVLFTLVGSINVFFQALAFVLTGMGITLGVTLAPMLLRNGVLQFINSGDPRAQSKRAGHEWILQEGDRQVLGSHEEDSERTFFRRAVQIHIPDAMIFPRHAVLSVENGRFFVEQHPENQGAAGQPMAPLLVRSVNVVDRRELRNDDDLVVGRTLLRFSTRKRPQQPAGYQGRV